MATKIFVNLSVKDLNRSVEFFTKLGYTFNKQFTNEHATSMIVSEDIYIMLLVEQFFKSFITTEIADTTKCTEVLICLSAESREAVDEMINKAVDAGGQTFRPAQDHGWMYANAYKDLDGHIWEITWMDMNAFPEKP